MLPRYVTIDDAACFNVLGIDHRLRLTGGDTGGLFTLIEITPPANAGIPPHVHTREDEVFHVVEGSAEFTLDGRTRTVEAGTTVFAPRNVAHAFRSGPAGARVLVAVYPAGIEDMFAELSRLPAGAPDFARVADVCGRYGIRFA